MENTIINHNWKDLIKPNKLNIQSNEDKSITTVIAEPSVSRSSFKMLSFICLLHYMEMVGKRKIRVFAHIDKNL